ncbi:UNVERIFIED_CONTAM: hypothetical protein LJA28_08625, partial [Campylobacter jejuni]
IGGIRDTHHGEPRAIKNYAGNALETRGIRSAKTIEPQGNDRACGGVSHDHYAGMWERVERCIEIRIVIAKVTNVVPRLAFLSGATALAEI